VPLDVLERIVETAREEDRAADAANESRRAPRYVVVDPPSVPERDVAALREVVANLRTEITDLRRDRDWWKERAKMYEETADGSSKKLDGIFRALDIVVSVAFGKPPIDLARQVREQRDEAMALVRDAVPQMQIASDEAANLGLSTSADAWLVRAEKLGGHDGG
jgi:hypothetical protein